MHNIIQIHPLALANFGEIHAGFDPHKVIHRRIEEITYNSDDITDNFIENLARGIAKIAAPQYPDPVIVRVDNFETNEYADMIEENLNAPKEGNPKLRCLDASRYFSEVCKAGFELECRAIQHVREEIGLDNVIIMVPFCRSVDEADQRLEKMAEFGLIRGENGLEIYMMVDMPVNILDSEEFAQRFDGFSIGSSDLTQLTLGMDRGSDKSNNLFDERDQAVREMLNVPIHKAAREGYESGIVSQAPNDYPEFASFFLEESIDPSFLNNDGLADVIPNSTEVENN